MDAEPYADDPRMSFFDTLTGYDPNHEDRLMEALDGLMRAVDERGTALADLKTKSDPPPPLPPAPAASLAA